MEFCILWPTSPHLSHPPSPKNHCPTLWFYEFDIFRFFLQMRSYRFVFLCLTYTLNIMSSRFIHVVTNGKVSFLFYGWIIAFPCICTLHFLYPFICWWTLMLFPSWLLWTMLQWTRRYRYFFGILILFPLDRSNWAKPNWIDKPEVRLLDHIILFL